MKKLNVLLNKIDDYLYKKEKKEIILIYLMIILLVGLVFFYFITPSLDEYNKKEEEKYQTLKSKLENLKTQQMVFSTRIVSLQNKIKILNLEKISLNKQKDFYYELTNLLDFIYFNQYKWGNFVKNVVENSDRYALEVKKIENKIYDTNTTKLINKKIDIALQLKGPFLNLLSFLYFYENKKDLIRISELKMDNNKSYNIKFSMYGYEK